MVLTLNHHPPSLPIGGYQYFVSEVGLEPTRLAAAAFEAAASANSATRTYKNFILSIFGCQVATIPYLSSLLPHKEEFIFS